jgi:REP element-mobilizing transposase RayT
VESEAFPLAYLLTFTCYGTWLHGDATGSIDRRHNRYGTPLLPPSPPDERANRGRMEQPPYVLDSPRRRVVRQAIEGVCAHRGWVLHALHVRTNHVHAVVHSDVKPERILNDFKAYASRALTAAGCEGSDRKRWTRHGSTRYLWKSEHVDLAVQYVLHEQGEPMEVAGPTSTEPRP